MRHLSTRLLQKVSAQSQWEKYFMNSQFIDRNFTLGSYELLFLSFFPFNYFLCSIWPFSSLFFLDFYFSFLFGHLHPLCIQIFFSIFFILFQLFLFFNLRFYKIFILRGIYQQIQFDKENRMSLQNLFDPIVSVLLCSAIHIALRIGTKEIL